MTSKNFGRNGFVEIFVPVLLSLFIAEATYLTLRLRSQHNRQRIRALDDIEGFYISEVGAFLSRSSPSAPGTHEYTQAHWHVDYSDVNSSLTPTSYSSGAYLPGTPMNGALTDSLAPKGRIARRLDAEHFQVKYPTTFAGGLLSCGRTSFHAGFGHQKTCLFSEASTPTPSCAGFKKSGPGPYISDGMIEKCDGTKIIASMYAKCPDNMAFYGLIEWHWGACSPLPAEDILSTNPGEKHITRLHGCLADEVMTGGGSIINSVGMEVWDEPWVHCTKINTARYRLGPLTQSRYYGAGASGGAGATHVSLASVPAAIRYSFGRHFNEVEGWATNIWNGSPASNYLNNHNDGCINYPYGSLTVSAPAHHCSSHRGSQLLYRGIAGDPSDGTPVTMFPDCDSLEGDGTVVGGRCIRNGVATPEGR